MSFRTLLKRLTPSWLRPVGRAAERGLIRVTKALLPTALPKNSDGKVCLNLGCGYVTHPKFVNVDALVAWHIHYICPVDNLRPFADESVDLVYVSHCLEHISHQQVNAVLAEWRRVLKPGGVLRLGVPDFDQVIALYEAHGRDIEAVQLILMGGQTYPLNAHFTAFTRKSLTDRLHAVGFAKVRSWERDADELTSLPDFTGLTASVGDRTIPLSLNVEAVK